MIEAIQPLYRKGADPGTYSHYGRECKECRCVQPFFRTINTSEPLRCTVCLRFENGSLTSPGGDPDDEQVDSGSKCAVAPAGVGSPSAWIAIVKPFAPFVLGQHYEKRGDWIGNERMVVVYLDETRKSWGSLPAHCCAEIIHDSALPDGWSLKRASDGMPVCWQHAEHPSVILVAENSTEALDGKRDKNPLRRIVGMFRVAGSERVLSTHAKALELAASMPVVTRIMPVPVLPTDAEYEARLDAQLAAKAQPVRKVRAQGADPVLRAFEQEGIVEPTQESVPSDDEPTPREYTSESERTEPVSTRAICTVPHVHGLALAAVYQITPVPGSRFVSVMGDHGKRIEVPAEHFAADVYDASGGFAPNVPSADADAWAKERARQIIEKHFEPILSAGVPVGWKTWSRLNDVADRALKHFGLEDRAWKFAEERSELLTELARMMRGSVRGSPQNVSAEIADVIITLMCVAKAFAAADIIAAIERKLGVLENAMATEPAVDGASSHPRWIGIIKKLEAREAESARILSGGRHV